MRQAMNASPHVAVVIPAFNEAAGIAAVVDSLPTWIRTVIVVDDGSTDGTAKVLEGLEREGLEILRHETNRGVGAATLSGWRRALELGADLLVKMDGDGQMDPAELPRLLAPLLAGHADMVKGNRFATRRDVASMPLLRFTGNAGLSFLTKLASGLWQVLDPCNGFIAVHRSALRQLEFDELHPRFFFESSLLIALGGVGATVQDVAMPARYGGRPSHLSPWNALVGFPSLLPIHGLRRWRRQYFLLGFDTVSLYLLAGIPLFLFGFGFGSWHWALSIRTGVVATLIFAGFGALAFLHPPSAPAAGLAAWCGLLAVRPAGLTTRRWLALLLGAGLAFLALALPLHATVLASRIDPGGSLDPAAVRAALEHRFSQGLLGVPGLLAEFLSILAKNGVLALGLAGAVALLFARPQEREHPRRLGLWVAGLIAIAGGLPLLAWAQTQLSGGTPSQIDLVRAIRYLVPLALLAAALGARELAEWVPPRLRVVTLLLGALALAQHVARFTPAGAFGPALRCWSGGQFACGSDPLPDWTETLLWLRDQGQGGGSVLAVDVPEAMAVRFVALRPLAWCFKDGSTFAYVDRPRLLEWHRQSRLMGKVLSEPAGERRWSAAARLADLLPSRPATLLFLGPAPEALPPGWRVARSEGRWVVLERSGPELEAATH